MYLRCNHCGSSWQTISNDTVLFCPFCSKALVSLPDDLNDFEEILNYLVSTYGKQLLSNQRVVFQFLEACLPNAKKESAFLRYAYASGIMEQICKIDITNNVAVDSVRKRALYILSSDYGVSEEWAKYIVFSIFKSIGVCEQGEDTSSVYIQRKAERNDVSAQYILSQMFLDGKDVHANNDKYIYWLTRASENGFAKATFELARCYINGTVCNQDLFLASNLLKDIITSIPLAAVYALNNIALLKFNEAETALTLKIVEDNSYEIGWKAYMALAQYHAHVSHNNNRAITFAKKAYEISPSEGWEIYYQQLQIRGAVGDIPLSIKVIKDAVDDGNSNAAYILGEKHRIGDGVVQNYTIALNWFRIAANAGNTSAQYQMGMLYEHGLGVKKDPEQAISWYRKAAYGGYSEAKEKISYRTSNLLKDVTLQFDDGSELNCPVEGIFDFAGDSYMIVKDPDSPEIIAFGYREVHTIDGFELNNLDDTTHDNVIRAYRRR